MGLFFSYFIIMGCNRPNLADFFHYYKFEIRCRNLTFSHVVWWLNFYIKSFFEDFEVLFSAFLGDNHLLKPLCNYGNIQLKQRYDTFFSKLLHNYDNKLHDSHHLLVLCLKLRKGLFAEVDRLGTLKDSLKFSTRLF
jgi:hypothetical protein